MLTAGVVVLTIALVLLMLNLTSSAKKVKEELGHLYGTDDPQFVRAIGTMLGPALLGGNRVESLYNGDMIFPAMLSAIRGAQRSVTFETYIYWSGEVGREFADALAGRARAGAKVHVLIDAVGAASIDREAFEGMKEAGVEIELFRPVRWYTLGKLNHRTHRKLLVIDGRIGFTGGVGIADLWQGNAEDPEHWRDSHFRLEGPAVGQMQAAFVDHWITARSVVLHGDDYFPHLEPAGELQAQTFRSGSDDGVESVRLMNLLSLTAATRSIRIANAYFVPDDLTVETLVAARERGVTVEVLVPGRHSDSKLVRNAALGKALAQTLADKPVALMRGHGSVAVGPSVQAATFRAYYTEVNARLQAQAIGLGGPVNYLTPEESAKADATNMQVLGRVWDLWKRKVSAK